MADNLPAAATDHDPGTTALRLVPTPALAFALGHLCARPVDAATQFGGVCAVVEELTKRGDYPTILASLPRAMAVSIEGLYRAHRGQRWASTGHNPPRSGKSLPPADH